MADDLVTLEEQMRTAARAVGTPVIEALPLGDLPLVSLDVEMFRRLVAHARPRVLYMLGIVFDLDSEFEDDADGEVALAPELESIRRRYRRRQGARCAVQACLVIEGVLHLLVETTEWYDAFETEVARARQELALADRLAAAETAASREVELREHARRLAAHPAFTQGRPSVEKRRALAEHLFRELDENAIYQVTAMADLVSWLASHGLAPEASA